jgi:hypothetical protein
LGIYNYIVGDNCGADYLLLYQSIFKKGAKMKKFLFYIFLMPFIFMNISGCIPLIIGSAAGALGAYAISKDTIQGETDKSYDNLWNAALMVSKFRGVIKQEDYTQGYIELEANSSRVWVKLIRLTETTTRLRISARKYRLPNLSLAQDLFVKIMEQAQ